MGLEILELVIVCLTEVMNTVERLEEKKWAGYFDETIVDQLNKSYQEAISRGDVAIFVLKDVIEITL